MTGAWHSAPECTPAFERRARRRRLSRLAARSVPHALASPRQEASIGHAALYLWPRLRCQLPRSKYCAREQQVAVNKGRGEHERCCCCCSNRSFNNQARLAAFLFVCLLLRCKQAGLNSHVHYICNTVQRLSQVLFSLPFLFFFEIEKSLIKIKSV